MSLPRLPDVPRERRRTATVVAVGAFAVLCVVALVLGLRGLLAPADGQPAARSTATGSRAPETPTGAAGSSPSAGSPTATATSSGVTQGAVPGGSDAVAFSSPSGNIRCAVSSAGARCDIVQRDWKPPSRPAACQQDWGRGLYVDADRAGVVCAGDRVGKGKALGYGKALQRGGFRCVSSREGVLCRQLSSRRGFQIARGSYTTS